jgi:hypothetical protein
MACHPLGRPGRGVDSETIIQEMSEESTMRRPDAPKNGTRSSNAECGPSRTSVLFAVALIVTSAIVAGLVLFAALASPA